MRAAYVLQPNPDDPLSALQIGEQPLPTPPWGWAKVKVLAASLNHHDLWSLRGVGLSSQQCPMILGCDASGLDEDGREVIVYGVINDSEWRGDETLDPHRTLLSELNPGTFAEYVAVPKRNLLPKPAGFSHVESACLGTTWLTAYRMLFVESGLRPGDTVLVQGSSGGMATALIALGKAGGFRVWSTGRTKEKRNVARRIGADATFPLQERLPERVDSVMETVGEATWAHSIRALRPGGTLVVSGATTGANPPADLSRVFFRQLRIIGSTMGRKQDLAHLISFLEMTGVKPLIDSVLPLHQARDGLTRMLDGDVAGKIVLTI